MIFILILLFFRFKKQVVEIRGQTWGRFFLAHGILTPKLKILATSSDPVTIGPTFAGRLRPPVGKTNVRLGIDRAGTGQYRVGTRCRVQDSRRGRRQGRAEAG